MKKGDYFLSEAGCEKQVFFPVIGFHGLVPPQIIQCGILGSALNKCMSGPMTLLWLLPNNRESVYSFFCLSFVLYPTSIVQKESVGRGESTTQFSLFPLNAEFQWTGQSPEAGILYVLTCEQTPLKAI